VKQPHWDLDEVKRLAAEPDGLWVQVGRAVSFFGGDARAALAAARDEIARLSLRSFCETQRLTWDTADIYGFRRADGAGWYMKLYIDQETQVTVISFHPLERPIRTNGGWIRP
jgi:hypothetical protein